MERQPIISFEHVEHDPAAEAHILERIDRLERIFDRIVGCRVVVTLPHKRHETGNIFEVHVHIDIPGHDIFVGRELEGDESHANLQIAIGAAFDAAERQLKEHVERMRDDVKHPPRPPHGRIVKLIFRSEVDTEGSYGFIVTADGQEIYFHENAVANGTFDSLQRGTAVRYRLSDDGIEGPQASFVEAVGETRGM